MLVKSLLFIHLITTAAYSQTDSQVGQASDILTQLNPYTLPTSRTRTDNVNRYCKSPRSSLVNQASVQLSRSYSADLLTLFKVDGLPLLSALIKNDPTAYAANYKEIASGLAVTCGLALLAFILCVAILALFMSVLNAKKCRKVGQLRKPHSKIQLILLTVFTGVTLLTVSGLAVAGKLLPQLVGFIAATNTRTASDQVGCAASILFDDVLNGNMTSDGNHYFVGTSVVGRTLAGLDTNITSFVTALTVAAKPDIQYLTTQIATAKVQLQVLPHPTPNTSFSLIYTSPTPTGGSSVASSLGSMLGNAAAPTSFCGALYSSLSSLNDILAQSLNNLNSFDLSALTSSFQAVMQSLNQINDKIAQTDRSLPSALNSLTYYVTILEAVLIVAYSLILVVLVLIPVYAYLSRQLYLDPNQVSIRSSIQLPEQTQHTLRSTSHPKPKRHFKSLFYAIVGTTVCAAVLCTIAMAALGVVVPTFHMSCQAAATGLSSPTNFDRFANAIGLPSNITQVLRICIPGGSGFALDGLGSNGANLNTQLTNAFSLGTNAALAAVYNVAPVAATYASIELITKNYLDASLIDIQTDVGSLSWLVQISNRITPSSCVFSTVYQQDSLVPSTSTPNVVPCGAGKAVVACSDFATCPHGCISMYDVMTAAGSLVALQSKITTRYATSPACAADLSNQFSVNYNNWHVPRVDTTSGVASVRNRWVAGAKTTVSNVFTNLSGLITKLNSSLSASTGLIGMLDPVMGVVAGLNCTVIGEDLQLARQTICVNFLNELTTSFRLVAALSYLLLALLCLFMVTFRKPRSTKSKSNNSHIKEVGGKVEIVLDSTVLGFEPMPANAPSVANGNSKSETLDQS